MKKNILPNIIIMIACILIMGMLICNISIAFSVENIPKLEEEKIIDEGIGKVNSEGLASTSYAISDIYTYISGIPPKTSVSEFKKQFNKEAAQIHTYKDATLKEEVRERIHKNKYGN